MHDKQLKFLEYMAAVMTGTAKLSLPTEIGRAEHSVHVRLWII